MTKRAVVLAGGGSRGGYQMGVWKALLELGIDYQIVTGTSVGALNGAFMVQGDYDMALELWEHVSNKDVMQIEGIDLNEHLLDCDYRERRKILRSFMHDVIQKGGADVTPLEELVHLYLNEEKLRASDVDFGLITVEYPSMHEQRLIKDKIPNGRIADFLIASAACFPAFRAKEIEGVRYIDGGYYDNMPVDLAIDMGADEVIAVDLNSIGVKRRASDRDIPVKYISSYWPLGNFLIFEKETTKRNMTLGYNEAMKAFGVYEGMAYTFKKGELLPNARRLHEGYDAHLQMLRRSVENKMITIMMKLAYRAVQDEVRRRRDLDKNMSLAEAVTACGEIAAELFGIDPTMIYDCEEFNKKIMQEYNELDYKAITAIKAVIGREMNMMEVVRLIHFIERSHITCYVSNVMEECLGGIRDEKDAALLAVTFPRATAAAFYINLLKYAEERDNFINTDS